MAEPARLTEDDPRYHTVRLRAMLSDVVWHARQGAEHTTEPTARTLFETAAEVCAGLMKAFENYERRSEPAWRR